MGQSPYGTISKSWDIVVCPFVCISVCVYKLGQCRNFLLSHDCQLESTPHYSLGRISLLINGQHNTIIDWNTSLHPDDSYKITYIASLITALVGFLDHQVEGPQSLH